MKTFKTVSNLLLLVATVFLGYSYVNKKGIFSDMRAKLSSTDTVVEQAPILASFTDLINQEGQVVSSTDFAGKHMLLMFGFSSCKRVCPAELGMISQLLNKLGEAADKLQAVFITIDPKNDTVERLNEYHKAFDSRIQMLTGDEEVIRNVVNNYKVYVGESDSEGDINHSSFLYLVDADGRYVGHFAPDFDEYESQVGRLFDFINKHLNS
ncbi:hypothetical protein ANAPC1_00439 [Anaplasma phagocytophilum]|uniref:Major surface protein 5 n=1 Tax=Anaplasma phagocytophilum TaxID=948 RepID=A0AA45ZH99_ANAPH|nr:SCO family protein [Anaplasma phagocytophilum]SBO14095.1 hypothetical protein ANAPC1_00439 [Anaplasma phagocytophilum]